MKMMVLCCVGDSQTLPFSCLLICCQIWNLYNLVTWSSLNSIPIDIYSKYGVHLCLELTLDLDPFLLLDLILNLLLSAPGRDEATCQKDHSSFCGKDSTHCHWWRVSQVQLNITLLAYCFPVIILSFTDMCNWSSSTKGLCCGFFSLCCSKVFNKCYWIGSIIYLPLYSTWDDAHLQMLLRDHGS